MSSAGTTTNAFGTSAAGATITLAGIRIPALAARVVGVTLVAMQFAVVLALINRLRLENDAFRHVAQIAFGGFIVQFALPRKWRLGFFAALSIGTIAFILGQQPEGWDAATSAARTIPILAIGAGLIAICHLPIRFGWRVALLVAAGIVLGLFRSDVFGGATGSSAVWPILGALFMFRIMIYLYDISTEKQAFRASRSLSYFFLIPNICFTLFPVIDYKAFCRGYSETPSIATYQRGARWMMRGVVHLAVYRLVYYQLYLEPTLVKDGADLVRFIVANLGLYLWVSGIFHFSVGLLHMFGFSLPETNRRYFLASSFTDYWRRVNIYWKDYIMKMVYYPAMFRMKKLRTPVAMILATALAFAFTWLLHSYQWYWLRGDFPITVQDGVFWGVFGLLVAVNAVREYTHGRQRAFAAASRTIRARLSMALRTAATFTVIGVLWSFWVSERPAAWWEMMQVADLATLGWGAAVLGTIMVLALLVEGRPKPILDAVTHTPTESVIPVRSAALFCVVPALVIFALTSGIVSRRLSPEARSVIQCLTLTKPSPGDQDMMARGYYEDLLDTARFNSLLNESYQRRPADWQKLEHTDVLREVRNIYIRELVPGSHAVVNGVDYDVNRWGMRDRDYEQAKPEGTYRIALLGASFSMGAYVPVDDRFESVLERRLHEEFSARDGTAVEVLDFAWNGLSEVSQVDLLEKRVLSFQPDAVYLVSQRASPFFVRFQMAKYLRFGIEPEYDILRRIAREAGIDEATTLEGAQRALLRHVDELLAWSYGRIVQTCTERGIEVVFVYLPNVLDDHRSVRDDAIVSAAESAGFKVITLYDLFEELDTAQHVIAPWDDHPNSAGHAVIAEALLERLRGREDIGLFHPSARPPAPDPTDRP